MPPEAPGEPWLSFLNDLDAGLTSPTELHCIGGFAVVQAYGLERATADIDVLAVVDGMGSELVQFAGKESDLRRRYGIYLDVVSVATAPENYGSRLIPLYPGRWPKLRLFALEAHDLALTKLERNFERDRADVAYLAGRGYLNPSRLRRVYQDELRPWVIGRESWHDQTLELWLAAYFPDGEPQP